MYHSSAILKTCISRLMQCLRAYGFNVIQGRSVLTVAATPRSSAEAPMAHHLAQRTVVSTMMGAVHDRARTTEMNRRSRLRQGSPSFSWACWHMLLCGCTSCASLSIDLLFPSLRQIVVRRTQLPESCHHETSRQGVPVPCLAVFAMHLSLERSDVVHATIWTVIVWR